MSKLISPGHSRIAIQICAASAMAALLSGCSSDAMRFNDPFGNPFSTGSIQKPKHVAAAKPVGTGRAPPVLAQALPPRPAAVAPRIASPGVSVEPTGSIAPHASGASVAGWSANGGPSVVVAQGETAAVLAQRYGVPEKVLLEVNGLRTAAELQPGARLTVPVYNSAATASSIPPAPHLAAARPVPEARAVTPAPARLAAAAPAREPVRPAKAEPARVAKTEPVRAAKAEPVRIAKAEPARIAKGEPARVAKVEPRAPKRPASGPAKLAVVAPPSKGLLKGAAPLKVATLEPAPKAAALPAKPAAPPKVAEAPKAVDPTPTATVPPSSAGEAHPEFRWPARGRIIEAFKGGVGGNDGINIAVPEGTPVKAAEGGVVAYAGSELKGYGNMVLIRHPNGFVSAYANNGEIDVKKGETVKRGQLIAKSGQSGNVTSPQLHFELRKGATPVDPTAYLAGL